MQHHLATSGIEAIPSDLKLPFRFCKPESVKVRLRDERYSEDLPKWEEREQQWRDFWESKGKHELKPSGTAFVDGE